MRGLSDSNSQQANTSPTGWTVVFRLSQGGRCAGVRPSATSELSRARPRFSKGFSRKGIFSSVSVRRISASTSGRSEGQKFTSTSRSSATPAR